MSEFIRRWGLNVALHGPVLTAGVLAAFHPTLLSNLGRLQNDPGDTLLNGYILEHSWRWLTQPDYCGTYWSPAFYYPQPLVLAYSENLLGTAPLYWLLRTGGPPIAAYQLWMMLVTGLTYVSFAAVLRRFGVGHLLAALGGFVFAFGLPRVVQIGHQQLLPHLFAPWAVLAAWRFLQSPTVGWWAGLLAASFVQLLASIYLGWFLLAGLAIFGAAIVPSDRDVRRSIGAFLRRRWPAVIGLVVAWAALVVLLMASYREANRGFRRDYSEVLALTPRPADWLATAPQSIWHKWLPIHVREPASELWIFPGIVPFVVAACGLAMSPSRKRLVLACMLTAGILALVAMRWGDWSAWRAVYRWFPGGNGIRAVGRVVFTVELFALLGGLVAVDGLLQRFRFGGLVAGLLLVFGMAEQLPVSECQVSRSRLGRPGWRPCETD